MKTLGKFGKIAATLAAGALAFGMFGMLGCSGTSGASDVSLDDAQRYSAEEAGASALVVEKSGFSVVNQTVTNDEGAEVVVPAINYAFLVKNDNAGYVAENVPFMVTGLNAAGDSIFSDVANCMFVYPGIDTAVSGTAAIPEDAGVDQMIETLSVEPLTDNVEWLKTGLSNAQIAKLFTIDNATAERVESDVVVNAAVTGDVADAGKVFRIVETEGTLEGHCVAVFTDAEGNILFGSEPTNVLIDQETLDSMRPAEGADAEAALAGNVSVVVENAPDYADFRLYVMPSL